jgi:hypothetical protein
VKELPSILTLVSAHFLLAGVEPDTEHSPPVDTFEIYNILEKGFTDMPAPAGSGSFIYDTAAAASLVKDLHHCNLSTYVRSRASEVKITGIGGSQTEVLGSVRLLAPFSHIRAWHAPDAIANILSSIEIQKLYLTQFKDQNSSNDRIECCRRSEGHVTTANFNKSSKTGFYMYDYNTSAVNVPIAVPMISEQIRVDRPKIIMSAIKDAHALGLSKDTIKRALRVEDLHRALSYTSLESLENIVRRSPYGFDILPSDVSIYRRYLHARRCIACAIGKSTTAPAPESDRQKATSVGERLVVDIFFIKSEAFNRNDIYLLSIDEFCGQIHIT